MRKKPAAGGRVAVLGLGGFGSDVALHVMDLGWDVVAVDSDAERVGTFASRLTQAVVADITDEQALRQLQVHDVTHAVVDTDGDLQDRVLVTLLLAGMGVPSIWAGAASEGQARILHRVGAHHVVLPEQHIGRRVAQQLRTREASPVAVFDVDLAVAETPVPRTAVGHTLAAALRSVHGVTVVSVKHADTSFTHAVPGTTVHAGDVLIVAGCPRDVEAFIALP